MEKETPERRSSKKIKKHGSFNYTPGEFAVQCHNCFKWRLIPTKDEYETIRHSFIEDPWYCNKKPNVTCDDPGDLECDETRIWMIDKPNLPKPPAGFDRNIVLRGDYSKSDSFYATPTGKKGCREPLCCFCRRNSIRVYTCKVIFLHDKLTVNSARFFVWPTTAKLL
ncbi:unnamed protein product [Victoria cruziana]